MRAIGLAASARRRGAGAADPDRPRPERARALGARRAAGGRARPARRRETRGARQRDDLDDPRTPPEPAGPRRPRSSAHFAARSVPPAAGAGCARARPTRTTPRPRSRRCARRASPAGRSSVGSRISGRGRANDGGFGLSPGRAPDAQSTAWAIQAFLAAGRKPGPAAWRFLSRLRRARRQLPLQRPLRDDAGMGDRAGRAGARRQAVPAQARRLNVALAVTGR